jgi:hypothetical protein
MLAPLRQDLRRDSFSAKVPSQVLVKDAASGNTLSMHDYSSAEEVVSEVTLLLFTPKSPKRDLLIY